VGITLWDWWNARNKANAGERLKTTDEICHSISIHHLEFSKLPTPLTVAPQKQSAWKIPPAGYVKVNFDASFYHESQNGAFGYVIRDDKGEFVAAGAGKLPYLRNALHGEAEACTAAMEGTAHLGIFRAIFESDSTTLVNAIKTGSHDLADVGVLIREARSLRFLHFDQAEFIYCHRSCNNIAHTLAKFGYQDSALSSSWMYTAPDCVIGALASDRASSSFNGY
jgi:hypothetical protein